VGSQEEELIIIILHYLDLDLDYILYLFEEKIFDNHVHFAGIRKRSCAEIETVKLSYWSVFSCFLFSSCDDRLIRFIVVGSGSAVDTG
jgi:hypothetical protein